MKKAVAVATTLLALVVICFARDQQLALPLHTSEKSVYPGRRWEVTDESGRPIEDNYRLAIASRVVIDTNWTGKIENELGLLQDVAPIQSAIRQTVENNIEYFELFEGPVSWSPFWFRLNQVLKTGGEEHLDYESERMLTGKDDFDGQKTLGRFWIVFAPGYHPEIVFDDVNRYKPGEWLTFKVILKTWNERQSTLAKRTHLESLREIGLADRPEPTAQAIFGVKSRAKGDPYLHYENLLKKVRDEAIRNGFPVDAAWLEFAVAHAPYRIEGGSDGTGGKDDIENGRMWKGFNRMAELAPQVRLFQAWKDYRQFVLSSPMGLGKQDPVFGHASFDSNAAWTPDGLERLLKLADKYEDEPLLALHITSHQLLGDGIMKADPQIKERFYRHRLRLWKKVLDKYPSAYWFSWAFDGMWATEWKNAGTPYPLLYPEELGKKVISKPGPVETQPKQ